MWGDAAYSGQRDVIRQHAPKAKSFVQTKAHRHRPLSEAERAGTARSQRSGRSRTCVLGHQADLRLGQSPVPGAGKEYPLAPDQLRVGKSLCVATAPVGGNVEDGGPEAGRGASHDGVCLTNRLSEQQRPTEFALGGQSRNSWPSENVN